MIVLEAIQDFTLEDFKKISNLKRKTELSKEEPKNKIHSGDEFTTDTETSDYLLGNNKNKAVVVKILEVLPEKTKKTTKKKEVK